MTDGVNASKSKSRSMEKCGFSINNLLDTIQERTSRAGKLGILPTPVRDKVLWKHYNTGNNTSKRLVVIMDKELQTNFADKEERLNQSQRRYERLF
jgi:hypothetical protein